MPKGKTYFVQGVFKYCGKICTVKSLLHHDLFPRRFYALVRSQDLDNNGQGYDIAKMHPVTNVVELSVLANQWFWLRPYSRMNLG